MTTRTSSALPERTPPAGARLDGAVLPKRFESVEALDDFLATPTQALVDDLAKAPGDILILGVAGKMGPTLARLAKNAAPDRRVIGVARFSDKAVQARLRSVSPPACRRSSFGTVSIRFSGRGA